MGHLDSLGSALGVFAPPSIVYQTSRNNIYDDVAGGTSGALQVFKCVRRKGTVRSSAEYIVALVVENSGDRALFPCPDLLSLHFEVPIHETSHPNLNC